MSRNSGQREQFGMVTGQSILSTVFQATDMDNGHCLQDVDLQQNLNTSPCGTIIGTISPTSLSIKRSLDSSICRVNSTHKHKSRPCRVNSI